MTRVKSIVGLVVGILVVLTVVVSPVVAGGGPVEFNLDSYGYKDVGQEFTVSLRVYNDSASDITYCSGCWIYLYFKDAQEKDMISPASGYTDSEGRMTVKAKSTVGGEREIRVSELRYPDGTVRRDVGSYVILRYNGSSGSSSNYSYSAPTMVYPVDGQTLDLEGAYMFKVNQVAGASGYLFGLFQDGTMVYENYRDSHTLSSNGEFALWESNSWHRKFHSGDVKVMIRALINNQWTEAREITINLKPRQSQGSVTQVVSSKPISYYQQSSQAPQTSPTTVIVSPYPNSSTSTSNQKITQKPPVIPSSQTVVVVSDSSASAELEKKVVELQQQLEQSKQQQSVLENRLNQVISWIKSIFPWFK